MFIIFVQMDAVELDKPEKSFVATIHRMLPDTVPERLPPEFNIDMEFNGDGKVAVWMTGAENPGKLHDFEHPFSYTNFFDNVDSYRNLLIKLQTCYVAGNNVHTFDGTSIKYNAEPKWTLITAHCVAMPTFAVFTRKIEGSDTLPMDNAGK
ncbi:hypothetical protein B566_EDAN011934 [Ephemera danica]|nr:hypothetical protein B566_EDAN011934 [Ephemera danica]